VVVGVTREGEEVVTGAGRGWMWPALEHGGGGHWRREGVDVSVVDNGGGGHRSKEEVDVAGTEAGRRWLPR
jgi:hypothetical protein